MGPPDAPSRRRGRVAAAWAALLLLVSSGWLLGGRLWLADVAGNLAAQFACVSAASGVVLLVLRAPRSALTAIIAAGIASAGCLSPRAERAAGSHTGDRITVVVFNGSSARLDRGDEALDALLLAEPDVLILVEPSTALLGAIGADPRLEGWDRWIPSGAQSGWRVVLSRWPQKGGDEFVGGAREALHAGIHTMVVDHPRTPFGLVQFHPASPRSPARWREGNQVVREAARLVEDRLLPLGLPVIAGGDLNSTPSGWRSRWFQRETRLLRAKPRWSVVGTYPTALPGLLRVAIDDIFVSSDVRIVQWKIIPFTGSDHVPVRIEILLPAPQATASDGSGDSSDP